MNRALRRRWGRPAVLGGLGILGGLPLWATDPEPGAAPPDAPATAPGEAPAAAPSSEWTAARASRTVDHPDAWKGLSPEEIERIRQGEIIIAKSIQNDESDETAEGARAFIQAALRVNQPVEVIWKLLKQTDRQHEFLPRLKKSVLIERHEGGDTVDFVVDAPIFDVEYRVNHTYDEANYHSSFHLDPDYDNDLRRLDGYWWAYADGPDRTLLRYGVHVNFGWFIPSFIEEYLTRRDLPQAMEQFKMRKESGGRWTKPQYDPATDEADE